MCEIIAKEKERAFLTSLFVRTSYIITEREYLYCHKKEKKGIVQEKHTLRVSAGAEGSRERG